MGLNYTPGVTFKRPSRNRGGSVRPPVAASPAGGARPASGGLTPRPANTAAAQAPAVSPANQPEQKFYKSSQLDPSLQNPAGTVTRGGQIGVYHKGEFRPANEQTIAKSIRGQRRKEAWRGEEQYRGDMARSLGVGDISRDQARHLSSSDMTMPQAKSWLEGDNRVQANKKVLQQQLISELAAAQGDPEAQQAAQAKFQQGLAEFDSAAPGGEVQPPGGALSGMPSLGSVSSRFSGEGQVAPPVEVSEDAFRKFKSERGGWGDIRSGADRNIREDIARLRDRPLSLADQRSQAEIEEIRGRTESLGATAGQAVKASAAAIADTEKRTQIFEKDQETARDIGVSNVALEHLKITNEAIHARHDQVDKARAEHAKLISAGRTAEAKNLQAQMDYNVSIMDNYSDNRKAIIESESLSPLKKSEALMALDNEFGPHLQRADMFAKGGGGAGGEEGGGDTKKGDTVDLETGEQTGSFTAEKGTVAPPGSPLEGTVAPPGSVARPGRSSGRTRPPVGSNQTDSVLQTAEHIKEQYTLALSAAGGDEKKRQIARDQFDAGMKQLQTEQGKIGIANRNRLAMQWRREHPVEAQVNGKGGNGNAKNKRKTPNPLTGASSGASGLSLPRIF